MKILLLFLSLFSGIVFSYSVSAAELPGTPLPDPALLSERWSARWIEAPNASSFEYGVYHFRKKFTMAEIPASFTINISADNRYRLFVNGTPVCQGPARGDLAHWYYETVDLAPYLQKGENLLAVMVWNAAQWAPMAQLTLRTALIVQGNSEKERVVDTNRSWKVFQNQAYAPTLEEFNYAGAGDRVEGTKYPWGWEQLSFNDQDWVSAKGISPGTVYGITTGYDWMLTPRDIPMMEETPERLQRIRRSEGLSVGDAFLQGKTSLSIPPHSRVVLLADQNHLTTAYPELIVSGGKGSLIRLIYAEALKKNGQKAHRDEVEGREIYGNNDQFLPDGGSHRLFRPLWFRTYRYIQMEIQTAAEPLFLEDFYGKYTGYPFRENAKFESNDPRMKEIWDTGWRTARLCAHETYFDCPYYEQLQYVGDTRIQALISLYVDGDDRLMRKAIRMFDVSRTFEGITASRYPSRTPQYIPPFSLYWINMVHDYWMHRDDPAFVKECIRGVKTVLSWYEEKIDPRTGMLGAVPHWSFVDWPKEWPWSDAKSVGGVPPGGDTGGSSIVTLQLAYTLRDAIELLSTFGEPELAARYEKIYQSLITSTIKQCWDSSRNLMRDDLKGTSYSQHANIMAILSDAVPGDRQRALFEQTDADSSLIQATFYYRFYLFRALKKVGLADRYVSMLAPWTRMLDIGLTTFAENPEPTRSDCHAWSSSPNYDFLATVCGIEPASPGFSSVRIEPHPGTLNYVKGSVPHPKGMISVDIRRSGTQLSGTVILPSGLSGTFISGARTIALHPGVTNISL